MRFAQILLLICLIACSAKPTSESSTADSTQVQAVAQDSVVATQSEIQPMPAEVKPAEPVVQKKDPSRETLQCKFQNYEEGDCTHLIFDCGDFGMAKTDALPAKQAALWKSLMAFDGHGDFPVPNPDLVGKTFEIIHDYKEGSKCPGPNGESVNGKIPNILSFKQISN